MKTSEYWRRSYAVRAARLTQENMPVIAAELGLDYSDNPNNFGSDDTTPVPHLTSLRKGFGFVGDWIVVLEKTAGDFMFLTHEAFCRQYRTLSEELAQDEKFAKVHQLVVSAMAKQAQATYHADTDGMDLVAIETAKRIVGQM